MSSLPSPLKSPDTTRPLISVESNMAGPVSNHVDCVEKEFPLDSATLMRVCPKPK